MPDSAGYITLKADAVKKGVAALLAGADIVTGTTMTLSGIHKRVLSKFGGQVYNYIADPQVAQEAKERGITRAGGSMEWAAFLP